MLSTLRFARHFTLILTVLLFAEVIKTPFTPLPVVAQRDISFGEHERQSMDIYYPRKAAKVKGPVGAFLFIHGGSWIAGRKEDHSYFAIPMAKEGYVTAAANYRYRPRFNDEGEITREGFTAAEMMEDIGSAIAKLKETAAADGIEIGSIALFGDSAGAHLALLYAYSYQFVPGNEPAIPISFVVARVAPTDVNFDEGMEGSFDSNILKAVTAKAPPTVFCYQKNDELVNFERHAAPMREKLIENGVPFEWVEFEYGGHEMLDLRELGHHKAAYDAIFAYADKYF